MCGGGDGHIPRGSSIGAAAARFATRGNRFTASGNKVDARPLVDGGRLIAVAEIGGVAKRMKVEGQRVDVDVEAGERLK